MRIRAALVVAPLVGALLFLSAGSAGAVGQLTVSNPSPTPGSTVSVTSTGWFPGRQVAIGLSGSYGTLTRVTADASGSVHVHVTVPSGASAINNVLAATGTASTGVPQQIVAQLAIQLPKPARAPRPWVAALVLAVIAAALMLASFSFVSPRQRLAA